MLSSCTCVKFNKPYCDVVLRTGVLSEQEDVCTPPTDGLVAAPLAAVVTLCLEGRGALRIDPLLLTMPVFATPLEVIRELRAYAENIVAVEESAKKCPVAAHHEAAERECKTAKLRLVNVIRVWPRRQEEHFVEDAEALLALQSLYRFVGSLLSGNIVRLLERELKLLLVTVREIQGHAPLSCAHVLLRAPPQLLNLLRRGSAHGAGGAGPAVGGGPGAALEAIPEHVVAEQLSLLEHTAFAKISAGELASAASVECSGFAFALGGASRPPSALAVCMSFFAGTAGWATRDLTRALLERDADDAAAVAAHRILAIASACVDLGNFSAPRAILMGLEECAAPQAKAALTRSRFYAPLAALFSPDGSYKALRSRLLQSDPPCLPVLGVTLDDLAALECDPSCWPVHPRTGHSAHLLNMQKMLEMSKAVYHVMSYQLHPFPFTLRTPVAHLLLHEIAPCVCESASCFATFLAPPSSTPLDGGTP
eukprot:TRINITY_DN845_c1_g1_i2.p1 TRINITY_DN845_c1_g1~~TRINITY_DN845_c1_g1_i2.p1  ORF type:complete len:481 (+),score=140.83 TRINITY_DN845_c1_g1_i2:131-1573(+)